LINTSAMDTAAGGSSNGNGSKKNAQQSQRGNDAKDRRYSRSESVNKTSKGRGGSEQRKAPGTSQNGKEADRRGAVKAREQNMRGVASSAGAGCPVDASADVRAYWELVDRRSKNRQHCRVDIGNHEAEIWKELWRVASLAPILSAESLVLRLPKVMLSQAATEDMAPRIIDVINVLSSCAGYISNHSEMPAADALRILENIADLVRQRLALAVGTADAACVQTVGALHVNFTGALLVFLSKDPDRATMLMFSSEVILNYKRSLEQAFIKYSGSALSVTAAEITRDAWKFRPTMEWLLCPSSWHDIGTGLKPVYEGCEEYADALLRVWTLLTFYWGCGAVFPKCWCKSQGAPNTPCGQPLLARISGASHTRCVKCQKQDLCKWRCYKKDHDAICSECLLLCQNDAIGPPGTRASTDIYDAVVGKEQSRGGVTVFHLSGLKSRKPPKDVQVNWKTTYRLCESILGGRGRLSVNGEPIARDKRIDWAEIVSSSTVTGSQEPEHKFRERGQICVRLLSSADCQSFPRESDLHLERGAQLAIIDFRVFVPEVVTVLGTLSSNDFAANLSSLPFADALIGRYRPKFSSFDFCQFGVQRNNLMLAALEDSDIRCIQNLF
jgi:hypothetical protein